MVESRFDLGQSCDQSIEPIIPFKMAANVQSMCQYWKKFDLQELQKELDTTATELANRQDESDISRKRLVELSREFKKNTAEDLRKLVAPLLKSFQLEVDSLSKRSKASEAAFLSVYKKLIDLPDPVSVLEYALQIKKKAQRVQDLEIENKQLQDTLDKYNHEFTEVKNQEVTIKQLRNKLKESEEKTESAAEALAKEKERELQLIFSEKERQLQETQLEVAKKIGESEQSVVTLQAALEDVQSELFEVKSKCDESTSARSDEMEMVMADTGRTNERTTAAEKEVEYLRTQLALAKQHPQQTEQLQKSSDMEHAIDILKRSSLEVELSAKEKEISQLVEDVQRLQASLGNLKESTTIQVTRLEEELASKNKAFHILEEKLKSQEDYEEIRRDLGIFQSVELSGLEEGEVNKATSLEMLLLEKNKTLPNENTQLKVKNGEIAGETTSSALPPNTEAFASMLGEEIAQSYRMRTESQASSPESPQDPPMTQISDHEEQSTPILSPSSEPKPPTAFTQKIEPPECRTENHHLPPPPSPHIYPFGNHMMPNFMGMNIVKDPSGSQGLDTAYVSKTVRELLSINNIGQRLFAKHVLGLSQGTVSELLSKPKSWDKLTEKGRESYRKMFAWATDERNISALKAISPKKGSQPLLPNIPREDTATEEKIALILNEAQQAMQVKKAIEQHQVANAMVNSMYHREMQRLNSVTSSHRPSSTSSAGAIPHPAHRHHSSHRKSSDGERHRRNSANAMHENEISSKEMVERIYKQELIKLAQAAESAGNIAACTLYQQELSRLAQNSQLNKDGREPGELTRNMMKSPDGTSIKTEPPDCTSDELVFQMNNNGPIDLSNKHSNSAPTTPTSAGSDQVGNDSANHAGSAFLLVRPRLNGHDGYDPAQFGPYAPSECLSPLQRMQNIANSLINRPNMSTPSSKPLKAVLPPITQEQFDKYSNVDTEELVKQVRETLSQYSISQRLFGESVLGLSQGSVSDLLARPKPWHMLTQKGREPFIRMQIFLEDAEAIPKLVASQYHIPPEKLMRVTPHPTEPAHRRRRSSIDDRGYESPVMPKRPRVFFTEEQKERLHSAYAHDPYPNQSTIEALANDLGVGVKTVINWFHNHRMRAKQQQHSGSSSGSNNEDYGLLSVKSEPNDEEVSNHSDVSSMSGDTSQFHGSFRSTDVNQWMFPQFEPATNVTHDLNMRNEGESNTQNPHDTKNEKEETKEEEADSAFTDDIQESGIDLQSCNSLSPKHAIQPMTPQSGVNKRKRSNPQYVSEGRQLDKTKSLNFSGNDDGPIKGSDDDDIDLSEDDNDEKENCEERNIDVVDFDKDSSNDSFRAVKIRKLQEAIETADEDWDEFDRSASIEKIQKNLETSEEEGDWEF